MRTLGVGCLPSQWAKHLRNSCNVFYIRNIYSWAEKSCVDMCDSFGATHWHRWVSLPNLLVLVIFFLLIKKKKRIWRGPGVLLNHSKPWHFEKSFARSSPFGPASNWSRLPTLVNSLADVLQWIYIMQGKDLSLSNPSRDSEDTRDRIVLLILIRSSRG